MQDLACADDLVCRLGGDEFAVLCRERTLEEITAFAQQLLQRGRATLQTYATAGSTPALSLGIAYFQPADTGLQDIMRRADQALYMSKNQGGHRMSLKICSAD